ncbi:hypothetical protein COB11_06815 [Candidatus Aerophobetes bacterium]|uniref:ABC-type glycine betaine transport system substrate-binding domain-containing protein n=1 Tax=Aerophobetes bacterium TaxID=2030807 RepID=A0A2A4YED0_UNCAE|nr:MAG: hypothetical protein COB11_06815 [Candidatus Aerophobetes bacterium]
MRRIKRRLTFFTYIFFISVVVIFGACIARSSFLGYDLVVGAKLDNENQFMAEVIAQIIEKNTQLKVKRLFNLEGTLISFFSILSGSIDCYVEYTGSGFLEILKRDYPNCYNTPSLLDELLKVIVQRFNKP